MDFPRRKAQTRNFTLGMPRSLAAASDGDGFRVAFVRSAAPTDPIHRLYLQTAQGTRCLADPTDMADPVADVPQEELDRRERMRDTGGGITSFTRDRRLELACFVLDGRLWSVSLSGQAAPPVPVTTEGSVATALLAPQGDCVAYVSDRAVWVQPLQDGAVAGLPRQICSPDTKTQMWGLPEFIAAEEMGRYRGMWWNPDGDQLLVTQVDEAPVSTWYINDPAQPSAPSRPMRYPAAGTRNAVVRLWQVGLDGQRKELRWDRDAFPYLADVRWDRAGSLVTVQSRDQRRVAFLELDPLTGNLRERATDTNEHWVELHDGGARLTRQGKLVRIAADVAGDCYRVRLDDHWLSDPRWHIRALHGLDEAGVWVSGSQVPTQNHLLHVSWQGEVTPHTEGEAWHTVHAVDPLPVLSRSELASTDVVTTIGTPQRPMGVVESLAEAPRPAPRVRLVRQREAVRVATVLPSGDAAGPLPVIVSSYGGPHAQRVLCAARAYGTEQWLADQGFAVVVIDGRGAPGVAPSVDRAIAGDLAGPPLADQITGLRKAADASPTALDLSRVGIRGWSFGGYLAALAVLRRPDVFHAAWSGAPVTDWRLYDTHYTERYLGDPGVRGAQYDQSSLIDEASGLDRPLTLVHGLADDNVVAAHTLRLSGALLAHGRAHTVLPLSGVTHMTPQEAVTENLLRLELAFWREHLAASV